MTKYMDVACNEAWQGISAGDGGPFGAVVVKEGKIIAAGHNMVVSSRDSTAHAEIVAIRKAEQILKTHDLSGCELYTTCYPCPMCMGAIMWARIGRVYYGCTPQEVAAIGFDDLAFYEAIRTPDHQAILEMEHGENEECRLLFKKWMNLENRIKY